MSEAKSKLTTEILRLLMQVAWADGELAKAEIENIIDYAIAGGIEASQLEALTDTLNGGTSLPAPDFGFLRKHAQQALQAARQLMTSDGHVAPEEEEMLTEIAALLGED